MSLSTGTPLLSSDNSTPSTVPSSATTSTMTSSSFAADASTTIAKVTLSEIVLGSNLGTGGFSSVFTIKEINLMKDNDDDNDNDNDTSTLTSTDQSQSREYLASTCKSITGESQYVLKKLKTNLAPSELTKGIVDLAVEAKFLETLSHPNIIKMQATSTSDPLLTSTSSSSSSSSQNSPFFIILEKLSFTLGKKLKSWRRHVSKNRGCWCCCLGYYFSNKRELHDSWMDRLKVARDLAHALGYLHQNNIVYRDLKPENVGFDSEGNVKIFDFGLAKKLHPDDRSSEENRLYNLTGNTGSLRYMAPEVALCKPYDQRVDSYSFAILFWQICSLTTPYAGYSCKMHAEYVVRKGYRPTLDDTWPESWRELMKSSWSSDIFSRPYFSHISSFLDKEISHFSQSEHIVPNELAHLRPKKKKEPIKTIILDVDTRLNNNENGADDHHQDDGIEMGDQEKLIV